MYKKMVSFALVLVMLCMASLALATGPSITTDDLTYVEYETDDGTTESEAVPARTAEAQAQLDAIAAFVASGKPVYEYFVGLKSAIAALLPGNYDLSKLEMNELISFDLTGAPNMDFTFATKYAPGTKVVGMMGIVQADGSVKWIALKATVLGNGAVKVQFPKAALEAAQGKQVMLAILSGP